MTIPPPKNILLEFGKKRLFVAEPSFAQIKALIALDPEPDESGEVAEESQQDRVRRALRQCEILILPPRPQTASPSELWAWFWHWLRARRFLSALTYPAMVYVSNILLLAAQGVDLSLLDDSASAVAEELKKKAARSTG